MNLGHWTGHRYPQFTFHIPAVYQGGLGVVYLNFLSLLTRIETRTHNTSRKVSFYLLSSYLFTKLS